MTAAALTALCGVGQATAAPALQSSTSQVTAAGLVSGQATIGVMVGASLGLQTAVNIAADLGLTIGCGAAAAGNTGMDPHIQG